MNCPICNHNKNKNVYNSDKIEITTSKKNYKVQTKVSECKQCGFMFVNPRKSLKYYNKLYPIQYRILGDLNNKENEKLKLNEFKFIIKNIENCKDVFDIGASDGGMLKLFKDKNYNVYGNEPNSYACEVARKKYDIHIYNSTSIPNRKYDLFTCSNVLEHIYDINKFIIDVKSKLNDNGYLYIEVPDLNFIDKWNNISDFFVFQHLNYFNSSTLQALLLKHGLEIIKTESYGPWIRCIAKNTISHKILDYKTNREYLFNKLKNITGNIAIFGGGQHTSQILKYLVNCKVKFIFDSNKEKENGKLKTKNGNISIKNISDISKYNFDKILISSYDFQDNMYATLIDYGIDDNQIIKLYDEFYYKIN
jgi:SAM-dependent methyltransferase